MNWPTVVSTVCLANKPVGLFVYWSVGHQSNWQEKIEKQTKQEKQWKVNGWAEL